MNATQKANLNHLAAAANHIRKAIEALDAVKMSTDDARYYAHELRELLSCDNGEGGLEALIKIIETN